MRRPLRKVLGTGVAAALGAAVLLMGEVAVSGRAAHADLWQYQLGTQGEYCEGCCLGGPNNFCCRVSRECRIYIN